MSAPDADFSRLPHDPEGFFGLEPGAFDRRTLKRRYTALLKIYKPERYPEEFQRLRAAYEALDQQLRYGNAPSTTPRPTQPQSPDPTALHAPGPASSQRESPLIDLAHALATRTPEEVYAELKRIPKPNAQLFFARAVTAEALGRSDREVAETLFQGLDRSPSDQALRALLESWLDQRRKLWKEPESRKSDIRHWLISELAVRLSVGDFFRLTESLWTDLLREMPFQEWVQLLRDSESRLSPGEREARIAFYLRVLVVGAFRVDLDWFEERQEWILEQLGPKDFDLFPFELDLIEFLGRYRIDRDSFLGGQDPLRMRIDRAIRDCCELPLLEGDRNFVRCQLEIIENPRGLARAFPIDSNEGQAALDLFYWFAEEVGTRIDASRDSPNFSKKQLQQLVKQAEKRWARSTLSLCSTALNFIYYAFLAACLLIPPVGLSLWLFTDAGWMFWFVALPWGYVLLYRLRPRFVDPILYRYGRRIARRSYERIWRHRILEFMVVTEASAGVIAAALERRAQQVEGADEWAPEFLASDTAADFLSIAVRFVH